MKEQELKITLTQPQYLELVNILKKDCDTQSKVQENHYFDTKDFLYLKAKEMLRVRKTKTNTILTVKRNAKIKDGYFECDELEKSFSKCAWEKRNLLQFVYDRDQSLIQSLDLIYLGCLKNIRLKVLWHGFQLELDQSIFSQSEVDYELECETTDPQGLLEILVKETFLTKSDLVFQTESKFKRFLKHQNIFTV